MQETLNTLETAETSAGLTSHARIIVISQFFGPDQSAVGQFLADFAGEASAAGHDVDVICGANDYVANDVAARGGAQREAPSPTAARGLHGSRRNSRNQGSHREVFAKQIAEIALLCRLLRGRGMEGTYDS